MIQITDQVSGSLDPSITQNKGSVVRQSMSYYPDNLISSLTDAKGQVTSYGYSPFKQLQEINYPDNTSGSPDYELFLYDANGNEWGIQKRDGSQVIMSFDALNRMISKSPSGQAAISYGYDETGLPLSLQANTDSAATQYAYDTAGRVTGEYAPLFGWTNLTLDANGNRTGITLPASEGSLSLSQSFDGLNRLTGISEGGIQLVSYTVNPLSQRTTSHYGPVNNPVASSSFTYTSAGLLASLSHSWNGSSLTESLTYNQDHQRAGLTASDASFLPSGLTANSKSYASNNLNQYSSVSSVGYSYDKRGNLTSDGVWAYAYNTENQLISANGPNGMNVTYTYDPLGRRLSKNVNGTLTYYASLGNQEIAEYAAGSNGTLTPTRSFIYGAGLDEPIASLDSSGNVTYQFADPQGSIIALANNLGQITEKYTYSAYGLGTTAGPNTAAYRYTGRRFDPETGLYYYRARMYSVTLGRFLQTDPIGTNGGINLYAYTGNDPVNGVDPSGNFVQVIRNGNNVTLQLPMRYNGATPSQIQTYNQAIESTWTGSFGDLSVTATTTIPGSNTPKNQMNVINVTSGSVDANPAAWINGVGGNTGTFIGPAVDANPVIAAHEAGHLMGLPDYYSSSTDPQTGERVTVPTLGYENDIMATLSGKPTTSDISNILKANGVGNSGNNPSIGK